MSRDVRTIGRAGLKATVGVTHYLLCLMCEFHFWAGVALTAAAIAVVATGCIRGTVLWVGLGATLAVWTGWGFWCLVRGIAGRRVEASLHKKIADAAETGLDVCLTLTDPEAIYYAEQSRRGPLAVLLVIFAVLLGCAGVLVPCALSSSHPTGAVEMARHALAQPAYQAWLIFLGEMTAGLVALQLSSGLRRFVRGLNYGRRFAGVEPKSHLA